MPQVTCPSGLSGEIRKLKVREENFLVNAKKARSGTAIIEVLSGVWIQTTDPGPYKFDGNPNWSKVLLGDQMHAIIQMRIATFGSTFVFPTQCGHPLCRAPFEWEVDLSKLPVQPLSEPSRRIFLDDNRFPATIASTGQKVWFRLLLVEAQKKYRMLRREKQDELSTESMRMQIIEVEGVDRKNLRAFIDDMDSDDADDLRRQFDDAGCGVETTVKIECPECDTQSEIELPFQAKEFWTRRRSKPPPSLEVASSSSSEE